MKEVYIGCHVLMTVVFLLSSSTLVYSSPASQVRPNRPSIKSNALDYLMLVYDIIDITFTDENVLNLEHDDRNPHNCMFVKSEEGTYSYISPGTTDSSLVCGLYVVASPTQIVEFQFKDFGVSCADGGLISVIDGWELNGQFFPSEIDHELPRDRRFEEFCGSRFPSRIFTTAQNVGLIEFRIPVKGQGFRVNVKFRDNPFPACNVVLEVPQGMYTLRNHGRQVNCTLSVLFPTTLTLLNMDVGGSGINEPAVDGIFDDSIMTPSSQSENSTTEAFVSVRKKCKENGCQDYIEVRGGEALDPLFMSPVANFCGTFDSSVSGFLVNGTTIDVGCGNTAVRLVSSGKTDNSVTIFMDLFLDVEASPCPRRTRRSAHKYRYHYHRG